MTVSVNGTTGITFNDASTQNTAATGFGFKNRIINGAMMIDQRNAGAAVTTSTYITDRFEASVDTDGAFSIQQVSEAPTGFVNSLKFTTTTADASLGASQYTSIRQKIEGLNVADLAWGSASASTVTLSFWVRSSLTGTFGGVLKNSAQNRSYPYSYTISAANTWEQKSVTITGDTTGTWLTTNGIGINVIWGLGVGSSLSGTAGSWQASNLISATGAVSVIGTLNATWQVTGVMLEKGSTATNYDVRPYGTELMLCQRYYCKSFEPSTVPADLASGGIYTTLTAYSANNGYVGITYTYPAQMRTTPTVTFYTTVTGTGPNKWNYYTGGVWYTGNATANTNSSTNLSVSMGSMSGLSSASSYLASGNFTASAEL
jgi:hypothetical protein